ncbi:hypothetical protein FACS189490_06450 [Clostridia bacterium]|nr:hypothetical protein FACS189490_06450 [Clostridia bacterium]
MNILNNQVTHNKYGAGTVTEQNETSLTVNFGDELGEKKFLYPSAFEAFLVLTDPAAQKAVSEECRQIRDRLDAERTQRKEEYEARQEASKLVLSETKRAAAKRNAAPKKAAAPKKTPAKKR